MPKKGGGATEPYEEEGEKKWIDRDAMRLVQKSKALLKKMQVIRDLHEDQIKKCKQEIEKEKESDNEEKT